MMKREFSTTKLQMIKFQNKFHTDNKIAKALNISISRVCQLRQLFGIPIFSSNKEKKLRNKFIYMELQDSNVTRKELAEKYGVSVMTISRIIKSFQEKLNDNQQC